MCNELMDYMGVYVNDVGISRERLQARSQLMKPHELRGFYYCVICHFTFSIHMYDCVDRIAVVMIILFK